MLVNNINSNSISHHRFQVIADVVEIFAVVNALVWSEPLNLRL